MSNEQQPDPEYEPKEKIQSKCWNCEFTVRSSLENTTNHIYVKEPWENHTRLKCLDDRCGAVTILFHDDPDFTDKSIAVAMQYPTSIYEFLDEDEAGDGIKQIRAKAVGAHDVEAHQLSQRQEDNIAHWGEFLQKMVIDVSDFGVGDES